MTTYVILFSYVNKVNKNYLRHFSFSRNSLVKQWESKGTDATESCYIDCEDLTATCDRGHEGGKRALVTLAAASFLSQVPEPVAPP